MDIEREKVEIEEIPEPEPAPMNLSVPGSKGAVIEDETLIDLYQEILKHCRTDRRECDNYMTNLVEMVFNEGDSSTSSKEAMVNLMKIKSDVLDKMSKIATEMTKLKLKEKYSSPQSVEVQQTNFYGEGNTRRSLIEMIEEAKKKKESDE